jgi:hypothetical protein
MTIPEARPRRWRWRTPTVPAYVAPPVAAPAAQPADEAPRLPGVVVVTLARILVAAHFALPGRRARRP